MCNFQAPVERQHMVIETEVFLTNSVHLMLTSLWLQMNKEVGDCTGSEDVLLGPCL